MCKGWSKTAENKHRGSVAILKTFLAPCFENTRGYMPKQLGTKWVLPSIDDIVTLYKESLSPFSGVQGTAGKKG